MTGQLDPLDGMVKRHNHLRIGQYHQHLTELLPEDLTPLEYMLREFGQDQGEEKMRSAIGRFGITGPQQVGERSERVCGPAVDAQGLPRLIPSPPSVLCCCRRSQ